MRLNRNGVSEALTALGDHLEQLPGDEVEMVICGGSALQALALVDRTTRDVDVVALARTNENMVCELFTANPLPHAIIEAARIVSRDFRLPEDWLNSGPTDLLTHGLPEGFTGRLHTSRYGIKLVIHFIDRFDQICLKTYAAINGGGPHHLSDLRILNPSDDEMLVAAKWCLTQDASELFPVLVRSFLEKVGYLNVAKLITTDR